MFHVNVYVLIESDTDEVFIKEFVMVDTCLSSSVSKQAIVPSCLRNFWMRHICTSRVSFFPLLERLSNLVINSLNVMPRNSLGVVFFIFFAISQFFNLLFLCCAKLVFLSELRFRARSSVQTLQPE